MSFTFFLISIIIIIISMLILIIVLLSIIVSIFIHTATSSILSMDATILITNTFITLYLHLDFFQHFHLRLQPFVFKHPAAHLLPFSDVF